MQAKEILDNAMIEANNMKGAAVQYTDQLLAGVEDVIAQSIDATSKNNDEIIDAVKQHSLEIVKSVSQSNDSILSALTQYSEVIKSNRADLKQPEVSGDAGYTAQDAVAGEAGDSASSEAINLDMLN
jgi:hypothetical protein